MAKAEIVEEPQAQAEKIDNADLLIGVAGPANMAEVKAKLDQIRLEMVSSVTRLKIVFACLGAGGLDENVDPRGIPIHLVDLQMPAADPSANPWVIASQSSRALLSLARQVNARVSIVLGSDLLGLDVLTIERLSFPILEKQSDLVMPVYPAARFEGLINSAILAPLNRALYGLRVRYPLPLEFSCSLRMAGLLSQQESAHAASSQQQMLYPATTAAITGSQISQTHLALQHEAQTDGLDLSTVLAQLAGSAFLQMEQLAPHWQRVRGSQPLQSWDPPTVGKENGGPIDVSPMIDSFMLASRNLQEVWGLVLPPVTMLELKHLARLPAAQFRMPDELWVRIIYDFALAHRLRTLSRVHLLGALTPLYLAWVASYAQEVGTMPAMAVEQRLEQLARAYESGKPYLVSRWRWPDRFNP
ncbi:hypothetical protein [Acidipila rosea]|uniref:Uncharacterized protein n=1 Tax=Acidipila rosea TaxID=768535 RepID=A0A4R1LFY4_9BACT|nr:hypothetical protein [Acidipila rosea]TCK75763.1 hypothetical protein C7378_0755 [Acidipila rosea]